MRTTKEIEKEIESLTETLNQYDMKEYNLKKRIEGLRNVLSKAQHREELERDGVFVNIVSVELQDSFHRSYLITTDTGLHWLQTKKLKLGQYKMTRSSRDRIKEINEEFAKRKVN